MSRTRGRRGLPCPPSHATSPTGPTSGTSGSRPSAASPQGSSTPSTKPGWPSPASTGCRAGPRSRNSSRPRGRRATPWRRCCGWCPARVRRLLGMFAVGRVINPLLARSQLVGGMIMGLSMALHEEACAIPPRDAISTPTSPATTSPHTPTYPTSKPTSYPTMNPAIRQGQRRGRNRHRGHRRRDRERRLARHRPPPANPAHPPRPRTRRRAPDREPPATAGTRSAAVAARAQHLTRRHTCCAKSGPSSTPTVRRAGPLCTSTGTRKASGPKPADVRRAFKASITPG